MRVYAILLLSVSIFFHTSAQQSTNSLDFANGILGSDLRNHLEIIASDELEGRNTGDLGQHLAAEYISGHFRNLKLDPIVDSKIGKTYYQQVDLKKARISDVSLSFGEHKLQFMSDFYCYSTYQDSAIQIPAEFVGYGIESEGLNEYVNTDLKGKMAIILWAEPVAPNGNYLLSGTDKPSAWSGNYGWLRKARVARKRGAEEILFLLPNKLFQEYIDSKRQFVFSDKLLLPKDQNLNNKASSYGAFFAIESAFEKITGLKTKSLEKYKKSILSGQAEKLTPAHKVSIQTKYEMKPVITANVLGFLKGSDSTSGTVVVTSHYDHIGRDEEGIYNGADDDGSGTVAVLEIAEAFAQARDVGSIPKKNVLFMTVTGEEKGLLGSRYFTDYDPVIPLKDVVANVNIDMVGRVDDDHEENPEYVYSIGSDRLASGLKALCEEVNENTTQLDIDYEFDALDDPNNFYKRSDHYNFAKNNIPVVFYFNGTHDDYHQHSDTVDKIRFEILEKRTRLIFHTVWAIANMEGKFELDKLEEEIE